MLVLKRKEFARTISPIDTVEYLDRLGKSSTLTTKMAKLAKSNYAQGRGKGDCYGLDNSAVRIRLDQELNKPTSTLMSNINYRGNIEKNMKAGKYVPKGIRKGGLMKYTTGDY